MLEQHQAVGVGSHNYHDSTKKFPIASICLAHSRRRRRGLGYNWSFGLLPFIEQTSLYNQFDNRFPCSKAPLLEMAFWRERL